MPPFLVADPDGRQLINGAARPSEPLPRRQPLAMRAQNLALESRSVVVSDRLGRRGWKDWTACVDVPIFKDGQPFRTLAVTMRSARLLKLLNARKYPKKNWKWASSTGTGPIHPPGCRIMPPSWANSPRRDGATVKDQDGIFEFFHSSEGDIVANASAHPALSGWTVGVAVKKRRIAGGGAQCCQLGIALGS